MSRNSHNFSRYAGYIGGAAIIASIYATSFYSYLLFHSLAEMVSIVVMSMVFVITWNSRKTIDNPYYLIIGISFLFLSIIAAIHALAYKGMGVFVNDPDLPTQLWIASRYYLCLIFLVAPWFIDKKIKTSAVLFINLLVSALLMLSVFYWHNFPVAYIDGVGLTAFKIYSEYAVIGLFVISIILLSRKKQYFDRHVYSYLQIALAIMAASDFVFTLYVGVYSQLNLIGHILGIISFYLIYAVIVRKSLVDPQLVLFKKLKDSEAALRESEHKYRSLVELSPEGIIVHNAGIIEYINAAGKKMLGIEKDSDLIGKHVVDFIHDDYKALINQRIDSVYDNKTSILAPIEVKLLRKGEVNFFAEVQSSKTILMGKVGIQTIFRDISEKREMEKAKSEFFTLASHQLKTPLAGMALAVDLLERGAAGPVNEELQEYLDELHDSIARMDDTIKSLLNTSKLELGLLVFEKEPIIIKEIALRIIEDVSPLLRKKGLELKIELGDNLPTADIDRRAIRLILENLVSNAIRYTGESGMITISLVQQGEKLLLTVADTGCGIPKQDHGNIFKKSFRSDNAKRVSNAGTGLGLYMVKSIADKVGVKIWFDSEEGKGSTFYVLI